MNIPKHREKNIVHPRGLFLSFCITYLLGIIIGTNGNGGGDFLLFLGLFVYLLFWKRWTYISIICIIGYMIGSAYGGYVYEKNKETLEKMAKYTYFFDTKNTYKGTVDKKIYGKEMSDVYRLYIDNIDTGSTGSTVSISGDALPIFIEVPKNIDVPEGKQIQWTGKIRKNISFPLEGYDRYAFYQKGYGYAFVPTFLKIEKGVKDTPIHHLRSSWIDIFRTGFPDSIGGILLGMTIGVDEYLDPSIKESFLSTGISHILVVSGANIAFLIVFMTFFMKYIGMSRYVRISIIGGFIIFYGTLVGWDVSVVRATIMGILGYTITELQSKVSSLSTLALAGVILSTYEPLSPVYDAGFGLSFCATGGILLFDGYIKNILSRFSLSRVITPYISVSVGATLGSIPVLLYHFGSLSIGSLFINILISFVLGWILFGSVIYVGVSLLSSFAGYIFGYLLYYPTLYIIKMSSWFELIPTISIEGPLNTYIALLLFGIYITFLLEKDVLSHNTPLDPK